MQQRHGVAEAAGIEHRDRQRSEADQQQQHRPADRQRQLRLLVHQPGRRGAVAHHFREPRIIVHAHRAEQEADIGDGDAPGRGELASRSRPSTGTIRLRTSSEVPLVAKPPSMKPAPSRTIGFQIRQRSAPPSVRPVARQLRT